MKIKVQESIVSGGQKPSKPTISTQNPGSLELWLPKEIYFQLPEGNYLARIRKLKPKIKQTSRGAEDWVRVIFEVEIPSLSHLNCIAGRNLALNLNAGSDLRNFLEGLLGRQFFVNHSGRKIDLETLCGRECEVTLEHFFGRDYDNPMVVVSRIAPVGTMQLTEGTNN